MIQILTTYLLSGLILRKNRLLPYPDVPTKCFSAETHKKTALEGEQNLHFMGAKAIWFGFIPHPK